MAKHGYQNNLKLWKPKYVQYNGWGRAGGKNTTQIKLNMWDKSTAKIWNCEAKQVWSVTLKAQRCLIQWVRAYGWNNTTQIWICEAKALHKSEFVRQSTHLNGNSLALEVQNFNTMDEGVRVGKALHNTECVRQKHYTNLNLWGKKTLQVWIFWKPAMGEAKSLK